MATTDQIKLVYKPGVVDTSGLFWSGGTTLVGVVCDLATNAMRFYVNDQILRVTAEKYWGSFHEPMADAGIAVGEPFVWKLDPAEVNLSECFPFVCMYNPGIRAEFIDWTPPS